MNTGGLVVSGACVCDGDDYNAKYQEEEEPAAAAGVVLFFGCFVGCGGVANRGLSSFYLGVESVACVFLIFWKEPVGEDFSFFEEGIGAI